MAGNFDPYYKWLGIPPKDQPPNFYRLLGIDLYEPDPEVIAIAAEQRIRHVQSFQGGDYALLSQKLQKKIIAVRDYLLDSEKKGEYDTSLKLQLRQQKCKRCPWPKHCKIARPRPRQFKHCQRNGSCRSRFKRRRRKREIPTIA